ncbi:hypothetical protein AXG93_2145s1540 [Marchantia polymorpha subsp. ruderalis]|uniref:CCHC-type domain-containing protein n=1 Tax=Marchantia polymorpha subsp. ruderalis TaxID=1480154 RepID=A0A176W086_MARPO|nr:hypothetical protein AXG93_2145s1540 [Marchantia polymorpha subsp. ruderalis]
MRAFCWSSLQVPMDDVGELGLLRGGGSYHVAAFTKIKPCIVEVTLEGVVERIPFDVTHVSNSCFKCRRYGHIAVECTGDPLFSPREGAGPSRRPQRERPRQSALQPEAGTQADSARAKGKWRVDNPSDVTPRATSKFFQQPRTKSRSDGYWRKVTEQQATCIDKEVEQAASVDLTEGAKGNDVGKAAMKHRGEYPLEQALAPLQVGNEPTVQEALFTRRPGTIEQFYEKKKEATTTAQQVRTALVSASLQSKTRMDAADEQNTATSPAPRVRRNKVIPRPTGAGSGKVHAADAGSKRKPLADGDQSGGRAKMAKSIPGGPVNQIEPSESDRAQNITGGRVTSSFAVGPETASGNLGAKRQFRFCRPNPRASSGRCGRTSKTEGGLRGDSSVAQLEPQPLTEGIRAKFPRKKEPSQDHTASLGAKKLSLKSSAIRKREMRAAKSAARAVSGKQISGRGRSGDVGTISLSTADVEGERTVMEHGRAAFSAQ